MDCDDLDLKAFGFNLHAIIRARELGKNSAMLHCV